MYAPMNLNVISTNICQVLIQLEWMNIVHAAERISALNAEKSIVQLTS